MKWLKCLLALSALFAVQLVAASSSYATSDYDNLIHTSPSLYVYTDGATKSQKMNISASWLDELSQTYAKRVTYTGFPSNLMPELYAIKSSGSLGILMREDTSSGNTVEIFGTSDPNGYCGFVGDVATGSFGCFAHTGYSAVSVTFFTHSSFGGAGCGWWWAWTCSDNGMNIYTAPMVVSETTQLTQIAYVSNTEMSNVKFYYADFDVTYPDGYAGEMIPTTPTPSTTHYTGTVDCMSVDPVSVGILQDGNNGSATVTPLSFGRAEWSYDLTSDPYAVQVLCGDKLATSNGTVSPSATSGDWICNIYENPRTCVLS